VENKGQYFVKMTQDRVYQICLKGKKDALSRRREQLSMREAAIKRQEQELKIREAVLKNKKDAAEPSLGRDRKGKQQRYTQ